MDEPGFSRSGDEILIANLLSFRDLPAGAPNAIHFSRSAAPAPSWERTTSPPWFICPVGFFSTRLWLGCLVLTLRPLRAWAIDSKSAAGSEPKSERLKPPRPAAAPWQAPLLQPALVRTGIISVAKSGSGVCKPATRVVISHQGFTVFYLDFRVLRRIFWPIPAGSPAPWGCRKYRACRC